MRGTVLLLYGKAGGAWIGPGSPGISVGGAAVALTGSNHSDFGWTAGFGLEWAFWNNWSVRAEYDYIGLNDQSFTVAPGPTSFGGDDDHIQISKHLTHDRRR